jgi:hypothetical protein
VEELQEELMKTKETEQEVRKELTRLKKEIQSQQGKY